MKAFLVTSLTPWETKIYDSEDTSKGLLASILNPVVTVKDDEGHVLYTYGTFQSSSIHSYIILGVVLLVFLKWFK